MVEAAIRVPQSPQPCLPLRGSCLISEYGRTGGTHRQLYHGRERDKRGAPSAILYDVHRSEFRQTRHRLYHQGGHHLSSHLTSSTDRIRTQRKSKALGSTIGGDHYDVSQRWRLIGRPSPASILPTRMPSSQEQGREIWPVVTRSPTKSAKAMANERRRCISRPSNEPADSSEAHRRQSITAKARP
jgi:hypothetical protein